MILSLSLPKAGAQLGRGTVHRLVAGVGDELRPGVPLFELRVDLESDKAQDCPPLLFFRIIATERGVLRALNVAENEAVTPDTLIGLVTSTASESLDGTPTRALRTTAVAIQIDPLSRR